MINMIDPFTYGKMMIERKRAEAEYNRKKLEIAFENYKKRVLEQTESERTATERRNAK